MPTVIECPSCRRRLTLQEGLLGASVQCPVCATTFTATLDRPRPPSSPAPQSAPARWGQRDQKQPGASSQDWTSSIDEQRNAPSPDTAPAPETPGSRRSWHQVRTGIGLVLAGLLILVGLATLSLLLVAAEGPRGAQDSLTLLIGLVVLVGVIAEVLTVFGYGSCLAAPSEQGAKALAGVTLGLALAALLCNMLSVLGMLDMLDAGVVQHGGERDRGASAVVELANLAGIILHLVRYFIFLWFLRTLGVLLGARSLVQSIQGLMILSAVAVAGFLVLICASFSAAAVAVRRRDAEDFSPVALGCGCVELALVLVGLIWYIGVLIGTRRAIDARYS